MLMGEVLNCPEKWCKYKLVNEHGQCCLMGALNFCINNDFSYSCDNFYDPVWNERLKKLVSSIPIQYHLNVDVSQLWKYIYSVVLFNDNKNTEFEDIKKLLIEAKEWPS